MSDLSGVTKYFSTANEGFNCTLGSTIFASASIVPLSNTTGLTDGSIFVGIIEPGLAKEQVFTGTVDIAGSRITGVAWTRGSNVGHQVGAQIVDYVTGTDWNMLTTGVLKVLNQYAELRAAYLVGADRSKIVEYNNSSSSVNHLAIYNGPAGFDVIIRAVGTDASVPLDLQTTGVDTKGLGLRYNGVGFRALPMDWTRALIANPLIPTSVSPAYNTWGTSSGSGFGFPFNTMTCPTSPGTVTGDTASYKIYMDAGTYDITQWYVTGSDKGITQFSIVDEQGVSFTPGTTFDLYSASSGQMAQKMVSVVISSGQYMTFKNVITGKNATSTGYKLPYIGSQIVRTA